MVSVKVMLSWVISLTLLADFVIVKFAGTGVGSIVRLIPCLM
jgi:hypothetical protein